MSRDPSKLHAFNLADALVIDIYRNTLHFPSEERFGLQMQLRRAAVSVASNIVEGSARRTTNEYVNFLNIAAGSASEARYLVELSSRLGLLSVAASQPLRSSYTELAARLNALMRS